MRGIPPMLMEEVDIVVDIDNTIADTQAELVRRFGALAASYPCTEVPESFFESEEGIDLFCSVKPFPGAAVALQALTGLGHRFVVASCRPHAALAGTQRWLRANGFPAGPVITGLSREGKIRLVVESFQSAVVFEDDPVIAVALAGLVSKVWVRDWPYNRPMTGDPPGLERFHSWVWLGKRWTDAQDAGNRGKTLCRQGSGGGPRPLR